MNATAAAIAFHVEAKTPLRNLGNSVRWFEAMAKQASNKFEKAGFLGKALAMRTVISAVYAERDIKGEYAA